MKPVKTTLFSLRVGGHAVDLAMTYLEKPRFRFYRAKHEYAKSALYEPVRWEFGVEIYKRGLSVHHKRDLKTR